MSHQSIDARLAAAHLFIENAMGDPEVLAAFQATGRGAAHFRAGRTLHRRASDLARRQDAEYADQYGATQSLQERRAEVERLYRNHLRWARFAFRGQAEVEHQLQLKGRRARTHDARIAQISDFYDHLLADPGLVASMAALGVGASALRAGRAAAAAVTAARRARRKESGQAQETTKDRDAALEELSAWMRETTDLARLVFADTPQRLERLGLLARS